MRAKSRGQRGQNDGGTGKTYDVGLVLELGDNNDGTEDLLLDNAHVGLDICESGEEVSATSLKVGDAGERTSEDGRLDEVSLGSVTSSTLVNGGSLLLARLDVLRDAVELELRGLGALEGVGGEGVSNLDRLDLFGELGEESVVDALLDVDTRSGAAALCKE